MRKRDPKKQAVLQKIKIKRAKYEKARKEKMKHAPKQEHDTPPSAD